MHEEQLEQESVPKRKVSKYSITFFRNALRSNLELTTLADTKAGILISINGFILTVIVTASGFAVQNPIMNYAFIAIILTSLFSIVFSVLAIRPRMKEKLVSKEQLAEYESLLYYQDIAHREPDGYLSDVNELLLDKQSTIDNMITHLHILGAEIKKKYFWLKQAYTIFTIGLMVSATLVIYGLTYVEQTPFYNLSKGNVVYKKEKFDNIFEPSGLTRLPDNKVLVIEDESTSYMKLVSLNKLGDIMEVGKLDMPKKMKSFMKKDVEDMEAITSNDHMVYILTSHSLDKHAKRDKRREKLIAFSYENGGVKEYYIYKRLKKDLIARFPEIFTKTNINIEGLSYDPVNEEMLLAFRTPLLSNKAVIVGVQNIDEVLKNDAQIEFSKPIELDLLGAGIRDVTFDERKNGFWIIAGSSAQREGAFTLWFWDRDSSEYFMIKNQPKIGFAEGIAVIDSADGRQGLFIVQDNGKKPNRSADFMIIDRDSL